MDISVIIPTYKPGNYIAECLQSLHNQSLQKDQFEVIIVLNGCKEPWIQYINQIINEKCFGTNIKIIQTDLGGVSNARNMGIEESEGEYIAFIDDDDYVSPGYLEELLRVADKKGVALSDSLSFVDGQGGYDYNYSMHKTYKEFHAKASLSLIQIRHLLNGPCMKLIPREVIGDTRFNVNFKNGEDGLFIYEITRNIVGFKFASEYAVYYRRYRDNSAVTKRDSIQYIWTNAFKLAKVQSQIFIKHFSEYKKLYSVVRIIATFKGALYRTFKMN